MFSIGLFGDKFKLFEKEISESRSDEVRQKLYTFDWQPNQTNAFELYLQNGSEWQKINPQELTTKDWNASWKDCPKEMLAYIQSLPEFDAALFEEITGLKMSDISEAKQKAKELRVKADELLIQAKALESSL